MGNRSPTLQRPIGGPAQAPMSGAPNPQPIMPGRSPGIIGMNQPPPPVPSAAPPPGPPMTMNVNQGMTPGGAMVPPVSQQNPQLQQQMMTSQMLRSARPGMRY